MNINLNQLIVGSIIGLIIGFGLFIIIDSNTANSDRIDKTTLTITTTTYITTTSSTVPINIITNTVTTTKISSLNITTTIKDTVVTTIIRSTTRTDTVTVTTTLLIADSQTFSLQSSFKEGENIPSRFTCDGLNISPPLMWINAPPVTESFVIIMDDPDTPNGVFTHWVIFNLPNDILQLPEGIPQQGVLDNGGIQGVNGLRQMGYFGPCPPLGPSHTYRFHLYAVDIILPLESGASKQEILQAIEGHILADTELTGSYTR